MAFLSSNKAGKYLRRSRSEPFLSDSFHGSGSEGSDIVKGQHLAVFTVSISTCHNVAVYL